MLTSCMDISFHNHFVLLAVTKISSKLSNQSHYSNLNIIPSSKHPSIYQQSETFLKRSPTCQLEEKPIHKTLTAMNDPRATLVILFFRAPRILEGTERSQNGATNPDGIFAFRRGNNLNLSKIYTSPSNLKSETTA